MHIHTINSYTQHQVSEKLRDIYLEQPREITQVEDVVELIGGGEEVLEHGVMEGYSCLHHRWTRPNHRWAERKPLQVEAQDRAEDGAEGLTGGCVDR